MRRLALLLTGLSLLATQAAAVPVSWGAYGASGGSGCGISHTYLSGTAQTEAVPGGCTSVTITADGGGGSGGCTQFGNPAGGGGGGGSGRAVKTIAVVGGNVLTYTVGVNGVTVGCPASGQAGSASTVSGTVSGGSVALSAGGGGGGLGPGGGTPGVGGIATGGGTNTNGGNGASGGTGNVGGTAGSGATTNTAPGGGGTGEIGFAFAGGAGQIVFSYS